MHGCQRSDALLRPLRETLNTLKFNFKCLDCHDWDRKRELLDCHANGPVHTN